MKFPRRLTKTALVLTAGAVLLSATAYATIPNSGTGVIYGCYNKSSGALRVIDDATMKCTSKEVTLNWNQKGPQGDQGLPGLPGPAGSMGPAGPAGANGIDGRDGVNGATGPQGEIGPAGPAGTDGMNGRDGVDGAVGATGPQGPIGPEGPQGPAGPAGAGTKVLELTSTSATTRWFYANRATTSTMVIFPQFTIQPGSYMLDAGVQLDAHLTSQGGYAYTSSINPTFVDCYFGTELGPTYFGNYNWTSFKGGVRFQSGGSDADSLDHQYIRVDAVKTFSAPTRLYLLCDVRGGAGQGVNYGGVPFATSKSWMTVTQVSEIVPQPGT